MFAAKIQRSQSIQRRVPRVHSGLFQKVWVTSREPSGQVKQGAGVLHPYAVGKTGAGKRLLGGVGVQGAKFWELRLGGDGVGIGASATHRQ